MKAPAIAMLASACGAESASAGPRHAIVWSDGTSDSRGVPDAIVCGAVVSHPCPWLLYTRALIVDGTATWTDAEPEAANDIGVAASSETDVVESLSVGDDGALSFSSRGDDGGLRRAFTLRRTDDGGWDGDVTWTLFTVAGNTTFRLTVAP